MMTTAEAKVPARSAKGPLLLALKLAVAVALIGWLVHAKALDFKALEAFVRSPMLLAINLLTWFSCAVVLATLRWQVLLGLADVRIPFRRASALQIMAIFFNVVIPGNVGGDVVKALYVARDQRPEQRTPLLLIVLVERVLGLLGLIFMAAVAAAVYAPRLLATPALHKMLPFVALLTAGGILGPITLYVLLRLFQGRAEALTSGPSRFGRILGQLLSAAQLFSKRPRILVYALLLSMTMHGLAMAYFTLLARTIGGQAVDFGAVATIFPLGQLTVVLPLSVGGVGVGHVAFDRLFHAIGLSGGATIFNVFLIGQVVPSVVGLVPYLSMRIRTTVPTDEG
jgi:uncharacterized protein (TIRG00374 family)